MSDSDDDKTAKTVRLTKAADQFGRVLEGVGKLVSTADRIFQYLATKPTDSAIPQITALKINKLMDRIDKPIVLPASRRDWDPTKTKAPVDFVRNVQGSSAGAGSGEFHVYRSLRRKEYARLQGMEIKDRKEREAKEYEERMTAARLAEEEKTAKRREKRKRRNKGGNKGDKKKKTEDGEGGGGEKGGEDGGESEDGSDGKE